MGNLPIKRDRPPLNKVRPWPTKDIFSRPWFSLFNLFYLEFLIVKNMLYIVKPVLVRGPLSYIEFWSEIICFHCLGPINKGHYNKPCDLSDRLYLVDTKIYSFVTWILVSKPLKRQPHKMVKHTQIIRRQQPTNYLSVFDHLTINFLLDI